MIQGPISEGVVGQGTHSQPFFTSTHIPMQHVDMPGSSLNKVTNEVKNRSEEVVADMQPLGDCMEVAMGNSTT